MATIKFEHILAYETGLGDPTPRAQTKMAAIKFEHILAYYCHFVELLTNLYISKDSEDSAEKGAKSGCRMAFECPRKWVCRIFYYVK